VPCAPFWGSATLSEQIFGLLEEIRGQTPQYIKVVELESWVKA
jgi:hypothetical protein